MTGLDTNQVKCEIKSSITVGGLRQIRLPTSVYENLPILSSKDEHDLMNFGIKHNFDFVSASYPISKADI